MLPSSHVVGVFAGHLAFSATPGSSCDAVALALEESMEQSISKDELSEIGCGSK